MGGFRDALAQKPVEKIKPGRYSYFDFDRSHIANPKYEELLRKALKYQPDHFDFASFRIRYIQTRQYDPFAEKIREQMLEQAYIIQSSEDQGKIDEATQAYRQLLGDHMANVGVVLQALSLARGDERLGNVAFFTWMRDGLMKRVLSSGDGLSLNTAYNVITFHEELLLIKSLRLKWLDTTTSESGVVYYNMHDVEDMANGETSTLFVNVTFPLAKAWTVQKKQEYSFDILRQ